MKLSSLEAIARVLDDAGVRCIVVGGLAVIAHGYARYTQDVDLVVPLDRTSVQKLFTALGTLGYQPRIPITAEMLADPEQRTRWIKEKGMTVLNFHSEVHRETPVDIFVTEPFDFGEEFGRAVVEHIAEGVSMRILALPTLLDLKRKAGRPQDLADVDELRSMHGGPTDG